jgi:HEAT repeat protein
MARDLAAVLSRWDQLQQRQATHDGFALPPPVVESGSALRAGADEEAVTALERRLGVSLPPSYRAFLLLSDGAYAQPGWGFPGLPIRTSDPVERRSLGLLDSEQVGWFRDREPQYHDVWGFEVLALDSVPHPDFSRRVPECEYLDHDRAQDPSSAKNGHVRYALQVSADVDGYTILLNPLVVGSDGEWEAWDFGHKNVGAARYRSFLELLEDDVRGIEKVLGRPSWRAERAEAAPKLEPVEELAEILLDPSRDVSERQAAAGRLGLHDDRAALDALAAAAGDPEPRVQAAVVGALASRADPAARAASVAILTAPGVEDWVIHSVPFGGKDAVWAAWSATGDQRLLAQAAACADKRAIPAILEMVRDPSVPRPIRTSLITYGWWWWRQQDPAVLVSAARLPDAPLVEIGRALLRLEATEEGVSVLRQALDTVWWRAAAEELGRVGSRGALDALLDRFRREPAPELALALGWYDEPRAGEALLAAAEWPGLRLAVADGLEKMRGRHAADALAALSTRGDLLATRALARLKDERALPRLLAALGGDDPELSFEGADGLRDLRSPAASRALLAAVERGENDDVVACAAHALVSMGAPEAQTALLALAGSDSGSLRRLAEIWARRG